MRNRPKSRPGALVIVLCCAGLLLGAVGAAMAQAGEVAHGAAERQTDVTSSLPATSKSTRPPASSTTLPPTSTSTLPPSPSQSTSPPTSSTGGSSCANREPLELTWYPLLDPGFDSPPRWTTDPSYRNWQDEAGNLVPYCDGDHVQFTDLWPGGVEIQPQGVRPGSVVVDASAFFSFGSAGQVGINGDTAVYKRGTGTLELRSPNQGIVDLVLQGGAVTPLTNRSLGAGLVTIIEGAIQWAQDTTLPNDIRFLSVSDRPATLSVWIDPRVDNGIVSGTLTFDGSVTLDGRSEIHVGPAGRMTAKFRGVLQDGARRSGLEKTGLGQLKLAAANTYTDGTAVRDGELALGNLAGSATGSGEVFVADGARLGGTGTIAGLVNVQTGGILAPLMTFDDPALETTMTIGNDLNMERSSHFRVYPRSGVTPLKVTGDIAMSAELRCFKGLLDDPLRKPYAVLDNAGPGQVDPFLDEDGDEIDQGVNVLCEGARFSIDYKSGADRKDVALD